MTTVDSSEELFGIIEEKGIAQVTPAEAHGNPRAVFGLWMAANIEFATLTTGALATGVFGLSATAALCAIVLANVGSAILLGLFSTFGVDYGLPQMILGTRWFGKYGNKLPALFNFFGGFSWFAVNTIVGAYALQYFAAQYLPHAAPSSVLIGCVLVLSAVQVAMAFIGHDFIQAAEKYFVYVLVLLFAILTYIAISHTGFSAPANPKSEAAVGGFSGAFILTTSIMVGYNVSWVPFCSDYTRYLQQPDRARTKRLVMTYAFWGALISTVWMEVLGAIIGASIALEKPSDLFTSWMPTWFKVPFLIAVVIGTISANLINIYSATMSALALGIRMRQHWAALLSGLIGTIISVLAAANFITNYTNFLFVLGYWIMPWIAICLIGHYGNRQSRFGGVSAGIIAWVATLVLSVPFYNQAMYTGVFARTYPQYGDLTFIVSFFIAAILYFLMTTSAPSRVTVTAAAE